MKYRVILSLVYGILFCIPAASGQSNSLKKLPPVVIRTSPLSGYDMVDPTTKKIKVTFNQKMVDKSWSWVMKDKATFPVMVGDPVYEKGLRTCVLNVNLEPNKTYIIWLNSGQFMNFKGQNGEAAVPYLLAFKTAGKDFVAKKEAALKSTEEWLKLLAEGKYSDSWTDAAEFFQTRVKQNIWEKQISMIRSKLGKLKSRNLISSTYAKALPGAPPGEYFILRFAASYENKPKSIETITPMLDSNGKWKVSGYFIK